MEENFTIKDVDRTVAKVLVAMADGFERGRDELSQLINEDRWLVWLSLHKLTAETLLTERISGLGLRYTIIPSLRAPGSVPPPPSPELGN